MKGLLILSALLLTPASMPAAEQHSIVLPAGLADKCCQIDLSNIEESTVPGRTTPTEWEHASYTPLIVTFPVNEGSEFTVPHPGGKASQQKDAAQVAFPPSEVYYSPFTNGECAGVVSIENSGETYDIILRFEQAGTNGTYSGTAEVVYRADGESTHMRGGTFSIRPARKGDATIALPTVAEQRPAAGIPLNLNGKKIQFTYPAAWKFAPMLVQFGTESPENPNTYTVSGFGRTCDITYIPDPAHRKAKMVVTGKRDNATIHMTFKTDCCGTAYMKWNRADYYNLTFRISDCETREATLRRWDDEADIPYPASLSGHVLQIDFRGAMNSEPGDKGEFTDTDKRLSSLMVIQFPKTGNQVTCISPDRKKQPASVIYSPETREIELKGEKLHAMIELDYADADSGLAKVTWTQNGTGWSSTAACFCLRPAETEEGCVIYPAPENSATQSDTPTKTVKTEDDGLRRLIRQLEKTTYKTAVERLYQKRLLTLLPQIAEGASTETVLPNANNSTALHYACGLSHVEIVRWLVEHGADLNARTAKGASVETCVGGPNAKAIRDILKKAKKR